jgi:hypothetical protein
MSSPNLLFKHAWRSAINQNYKTRWLEELISFFVGFHGIPICCIHVSSGAQCISCVKHLLLDRPAVDIERMAGTEQNARSWINVTPELLQRLGDLNCGMKWRVSIIVACLLQSMCWDRTITKWSSLYHLPPPGSGGRPRLLMLRRSPVSRKLAQRLHNIEARQIDASFRVGSSISAVWGLWWMFQFDFDNMSEMSVDWTCCVCAISRIKSSILIFSPRRT